MIHSFITFIENIIIPMGWMGVFFAEILEEVIVPIPSALVLFTSGFILLDGEISPSFFKDLLFVITIPGAIGLTLGSLFIYYLTFYGGKLVIEKYGGYLGVSWQEFVDFDERMNKSKYDEFLFVVSRIVPIVPSSLVAVFGGLTRMPLKKYITLTLVGAFFKAMIYGFVGYKVGYLYKQYAEQVGHFEDIGLVIIFITIMVFLSNRVYKKYFR